MYIPGRFRTASSPLSTVICPAPYSFGLSFDLVIYSLACHRQKSTPKTHRKRSVGQIRKCNPKQPSTQQSGAILRYLPPTTYNSCCGRLTGGPQRVENRDHQEFHAEGAERCATAGVYPLGPRRTRSSARGSLRRTIEAFGTVDGAGQCSGASCSTAKAVLCDLCALCEKPKAPARPGDPSPSA
jgi:hypothetical protein